MAGYILKIMLEGTHPPVWRRILVPEKITFADLHQDHRERGFGKF